MKGWCIWLLVAVALLAGSATAREWVSQNGTRVEADFVKLEDGQVHLRRPDGELGQIALDQLSDRDQAYIESLGPGRNLLQGGALPGYEAVRRAPAFIPWLIVIAILNLPLSILWGKMFFGGWAEFFECLRYSLTPDLVSMFRGDWSEDMMATWKLQFFWLWCIGLTLVQMFLFLQFIAPRLG